MSIFNISVKNLLSSRGNPVPNQFVITGPDGRLFKSYNSNIAFIPSHGGPIELGENWDYSNTTGKYRNQFLRETKKETQRKIDSGIYILNKDL
jgi:hypothetical protein